MDDTDQALKKFASWYLRKMDPLVITLTGSNGKTTTKDLITAILSQKYRVHKTAENENNQLGVPKTILSMPEDAEVIVLEMGMSYPGEIAILSQIAPADISAIID